MPELLFPEAKRFNDLFTKDPESPTRVLRGNGAVWEIRATMYVSGTRGYYHFPVKPADVVIEKLRPHMVVSDRMSWKAVVRDDGTTLLLIEYNKILGSRWLAIVNTDTLPQEEES